MKTINIALVALGLVASSANAALLYVSTQGATNPPAFNGTNPGGGLCPSGQCGSYIGVWDSASSTVVPGSLLAVTGLQPQEELFDIAVNAAGEIYGVTFTRTYKISLGATAVATQVGTDVDGTHGRLNGLAFLGSTLWATGAGPKLYQIDLLSGATSERGTWGAAFPSVESGGDISFVENRLFIATNGNQIGEITGFTAGGAASTVLGLTLGTSQLGIGVETFKGLGSDGGNLYLVADNQGGSLLPRIYQIDIALGANFGTSLGAGPVLSLASGIGLPVAWRTMFRSPRWWC